jgi:hypothetical protein
MATALRPRTATELVDAAFQLLRRYYLQFVSIAAVFLIPVVILEVTAMTPQRQGALPSSGFIVAGIAVIMLAFLSTWAVTVGVSDGYLGNRVDPIHAIRRVLARLLPLLGGTLVTFAFVGTVMLLLMLGFTFVTTGVSTMVGGRAGAIAGLLATVLGSGGVALGFLATYARIFAVPMVIVLEGTSVGEAFSRSLALTEGAVWRVMGVFVLVFCIFAAILVLMLMLGTFVTVQYPRLVTVYTVLSGTLNAFVYPIYTVFVTLLYYDLRIRRDGLDLEVMTRDLTGAAPA